MSDKPPKPRKGSSGEHAAVKAFRAKMQSVSDHTLPLLYNLNADLDEKLAKQRQIEASLPPPAKSDPEIEEERPSQAPTPVRKDPRREPPSDSRLEDEPPIDIVSDPFPSTKRSGKV